MFRLLYSLVVRDLNDHEFGFLFLLNLTALRILQVQYHLLAQQVKVVSFEKTAKSESHVTDFVDVQEDEHTEWANRPIKTAKFGIA